MHPARRAGSAVFLAAVLAAAPAAPCAAADAPAAAPDAARLAAQVRQEFAFSWNAYKSYAWGHDELAPLSRTGRDWYGVSFLMTPVDSLDSMILMGLADEATRTREYIATHLSFDRDVFVSVFEFTIRLLGGLLSGYQMTGDARLLDLARDLADREMPAFRSPTGMPYGDVNLKTGAVRRPVSDPAEIGSLLLELGTLSRITGNPAYYAAAKKASQAVFQRRSRIGLLGQAIDVRSGAWMSRDSHIGGAIDSYYEYLLKGSILFGDRDLAGMWSSSVEAVERYLEDTSHGGLWYGHADMVSGARGPTVFGALEAFFPAELALSGDLTRARRLEDSCFAMWQRYGVEPEQIDYARMSAISPEYHLRPEIMESAYYLFHVTGDQRYRDMGRQFLSDLSTFCRTDAGYAELASVITRRKADVMPSYFLAETLKYLYLLFAPAGTLDFDKVIFNTEAHPLRRSP